LIAQFIQRILALWMLLCASSVLVAQDPYENKNQLDESDRITHFHSSLTVDVSGVLHVVETIRVFNGNGGANSDNDEIQRGIVRSFPTRYTARNGLLSDVPFEILSVKKEGVSEPFHTEESGNGIVIYIGNPETYLELGFYTYEITYETDRQLIFHKEKDELYWNVNGNGWSFSIDSVRCEITFPVQSKVIEYQCYTGTQGSTAQSCHSTLDAPNKIAFSTVERIGAYEGLTVAAAISKGVLATPTRAQSALNLLRDNYIIPLMIIGVVLLFLLLYRGWNRHGRDPKAGTIIPQFAPPKDFSPADVGYLLHQKFQSHLFSASIIDHAVRGLVTIEISKVGVLKRSTVYHFHRPEKFPASTANGITRHNLYGYDIQDLYGQKAEKGEYNAVIAKAFAALHAELKNRILEYKGKGATFEGLLRLNENYIGLGVLLLFVMGIGSIVVLAINFAWLALWITIGLFTIALITQIVFSRIMSAYSEEGRKIVDHILGFKMYLEAAEQRKFDAMNPPEQTIQLFEEYLPYAIALKCENQWAEKFESIIQHAIDRGEEPSYYRHSGGGHFSAAVLASGISSGLNSTISSATTPPSSSSGGSSGGGSSGGGGGGGGGGGW